MTLKVLANDVEYEYALSSQLSEIDSTLLAATAASASTPRNETNRRDSSSSTQDENQNDWIASLELMRKEFADYHQIYTDEVFAKSIVPALHGAATAAKNESLEDRENQEETDRRFAEMLALGFSQEYDTPPNKNKNKTASENEKMDIEFSGANEPVTVANVNTTMTDAGSNSKTTKHVFNWNQTIRKKSATGQEIVIEAPSMISKTTIISSPTITQTKGKAKEGKMPLSPKLDDILSVVPDTTAESDIQRSRSPVPTGTASMNLIPILADMIGWEMPASVNLATSSTRAAGNIYPAEEIQTCDICGSDVKQYRAIPLTCGHVHCTDCLRENHLLVLRRSSAYPPRCCSAIPLSTAAEVLTSRELSGFLQLHFENESGGSKFNCSNIKCGRMILSACIRDDIGYCLHCESFTCAFCKNPSHEGTVCTEDHETTQLLETAKKEGWSKCFKCNYLVERNQGCYHMTCRCGAQFCYLCHAQWKSCQCPHFEEGALLGQATGRARKAIQLTARKLSALAKSQYRVHAERQRSEQEEVESSLQRIRSEKEDVRHVADQIVLLRAEEWAERKENLEKVRQERVNKQVKKDRRLFLSRLFLLKLEAANDRVVKNTKGKGRKKQDQFDEVVKKLVEYATDNDNVPEEKSLSSSMAIDDHDNQAATTTDSEYHTGDKMESTEKADKGKGKMATTTIEAEEKPDEPMSVSYKCEKKPPQKQQQQFDNGLWWPGKYEGAGTAFDNGQPKLVGMKATEAAAAGKMMQ